MYNEDHCWGEVVVARVSFVSKIKCRGYCIKCLNIRVGQVMLYAVKFQKSFFACILIVKDQPN